MGATVMPVPADQPPNGAAAPWPPLSRRECEVAALVAEGFSNREIAQRLVIAKRTVDAHLEHILAKLAFSSRAQVATWVTERRSDRESNGDGGGDDGEPGRGAVWPPPTSPSATMSAPAEIGSQPSPGGPGGGSAAPSAVRQH